MTNVIGTMEIICEGCGILATVLKYQGYTPKFCTCLCANRTHNPPLYGPKCTIDGCEKVHAHSGLCQMHAWRLKHYGDVSHYIYQKQCNVESCSRPHASNGWCCLHNARMKRTGSTEDPPKYILDMKRYRQRKIPGHPLTMRNGRVFVHRAVLYDAIGPGMHPCHWCAIAVFWEKIYPKDMNALIVDHLDHNRHNNVLENLVPACNSCNSRRRRLPISAP